MLYICIMKKQADQQNIFAIQQESFLKEIRTAVFLYLLQDDAIYVTNSFPHLHKHGVLLNANGILSFHIHEFYEIILLVKGHLLHEINGSHHILEPGALVFVRPYDLHRLIPVNSERTLFASLILARSVVNEIISFLCMPTITNQINTSPEAPHTQLSPDKSREIMLQMERVSNEQAVSPETSVLSARILAARLFADHLIPAKHTRQHTENPPLWLQRLRDEAENWKSLKDGAQRMHQCAACHPSHLCKSFKRYYEETPTDFINRIRLFRAARELKTSDTKIAAIAATLGFESLSHFHRLFKRHYRVTPAEYRRRSAATETLN